MRYNVSQLLKEHVGATRHYQLQEDISELDPSLKPLTDLVGNVDLIRTNEGILVRADLRTNVELTCSRCLVQFSMPVRFRIDEEFHPTIDILTGARLPQPDDADEATKIDAHHLLDLSEIVRQDLTLALPLVPLCRNDCKGLCPNCGKNWNEGDCECADVEMDPRFAILKQLLDEPENLN
ncbi:MAG: DUF177 domain-containing protein [Chloroflexota bacterium]|nr:MAG: DUF177 domain-containing protein [Chloroflexota bacterium]